MRKYRWQAISLVLVAFMLGCNEFMVVGVISDIARSLNVTVAAAGYLVTVFAIVYAISTPVITVLTNRFGRYPLLMTLMVIFLIGNTWSGFASNYWTFLISRLMTAAVAGSIEAMIIVFANDIEPHKKRALLISWIAAGFSVASVVGVPVGAAISAATSWHVSFHLISGLSLVTCLILGWLLPKNVQHVSGGIKDQLVLLTDRRVYLGAVLVSFSAATLYAYYTYIRPLLTTQLGFDLKMMTVMLSLLGIMDIIGNRLSGTIAERSGVHTLPWYYLAQIGLFLVMPFALTATWPGYTVLLVLMLIIPIINSPIQIHFLDVAEADYPQATAFASSLNAIFYNVGISLGSATAAGSLTHFGLGHLSWGSLVFAVIALVLTILLNRAIAAHREENALEN